MIVFVKSLLKVGKIRKISEYEEITFSISSISQRRHVGSLNLPVLCFI